MSNNKRLIILLVISIVIVISATVAVTYSYLSVSASQTTPNELTTTCFDVTMNDNNGSSAISLNSAGNYAYPMSEANATTNLTPYTFTITNNCTALTASDSVNFDVLVNTLTSPASTLTNYLRYRLDITAATNNTLVGNGTSAMLTASANAYTLNSSVKTGANANIADSYRIGLGVLAPGSSITYRLYMWIDENACSGNTCESTVMGKTFNGRLLVYPYMS